MVVREFYRTRNDGINLYRTYSDEGYIILQNETGIEYNEAIDVENALYTYSEINKKIEERVQLPMTNWADFADIIEEVAE